MASSALFMMPASKASHYFLDDILNSVDVLNPSSSLKKKRIHGDATTTTAFLTQEKKRVLREVTQPNPKKILVAHDRDVFCTQKKRLPLHAPPAAAAAAAAEICKTEEDAKKPTKEEQMKPRNAAQVALDIALIRRERQREAARLALNGVVNTCSFSNHVSSKDLSTVGLRWTEGLLY